MVKRANYDDLASFRTPTQRHNDAQIAMVQTDIKRIDLILASGGEDGLKALHIDLDGTYQNLIKNWGSSTYNYIQGHGYTYEYMDESALRDNLITIRGKLRGLLLQLSPNAEDFFSVDSASVVNGDSVAANEGKSDDLPARSNMYDIIKGRKFDVVKEYARIWKLFNTADIVGPCAVALSLQISASMQFFPDSFKNRALSLDDFNDIFGFRFSSPNEFITEDELISYCEYVVTLCDHMWEYANDSLEDDSDYLRDDLFKTIASCMDELGLVPAKRDNITIFVNKNPEVIAVSEIVDDSLAYDVKSYIHKKSKGDLYRKKTILKFLADDYEPQKGVLKSINSTFASNLSQMFQKFIRHNNEDNSYIKGLSPRELEECYDDIYQMWLLAKLEIDNLERKKRVESVLQKINA